MTLFAMIFFHIIDDFYLQGKLASMKQKEWWRSNAPDPLYANDYKIALAIHAVSWTIMIMAPICWAYVDDVNPYMYTASIIINACVHAWVDDLKANKKKINLITDQLVHLGQIAITWSIFFM